MAWRAINDLYNNSVFVLICVSIKEHAYSSGGTDLSSSYIYIYICSMAIHIHTSMHASMFGIACVLVQSGVGVS